ncbi:hypothetical protein B488_05190 [Liberibacter crescens BT-1]|uniref:Uncharacterized protein n=1 Tax=Liberibacter crescens (strain BT-1) TaxID=1215343 RepID=L0EVX2_LIBCB|nr:hypothetical protein [Liberibacter crescens]AGA64511.1 hypothetical protein B488_05190 [Liberibacter crescens BT-1]AMC12666.1 hypothetical protein RL73_02690 [Liberibacter crescens]
MPYTGNIYSLPAGTKAKSGDVVRSDSWNNTSEDLAEAQNAKRPVNAGGTGASTAEEARKNLNVPAIGDVLPITGGTVKGDLVITGNETVNGNLGVTGNETINGILTVLGAIISKGDLVITGNETVNGNLGVTGNETINGILTVLGSIISKGDLSGSVNLIVQQGPSGGNWQIVFKDNTGANRAVIYFDPTGNFLVIEKRSPDGKTIETKLDMSKGTVNITGNLNVTGNLIVNGRIIA